MVLRHASGEPRAHRCVAFACLVWLAGAVGCAPSVSEDELAKRVASCRPTWQNYHEDIKGQIGAGPVAEWEGSLEAVEARVGSVTATFRISGPWAGRDVAIPMLLQEPLNGAHQNNGAQREGDRVIYRFDLPSADGALPWIELRFPHHTRRVAIPPGGIWQNRD